MAKTERHVHKFKRHKYSSGTAVYFCCLPDCIIKTTIAMSLGKRCICWRCGEPFILNEYSIRLAKPHCEACHQVKKDKLQILTIEEANELIPPKELTLSEKLTAILKQNNTANGADIKQEEDEI